MGTSEFVYYSVGVENLHSSAFSTFVSDSTDVLYSDLSFYCMYLFGCVGLRNKKHCIFNKQYSIEDFNVLKTKIINHMKETGEWGEFFPAKLSPFSYNESVAQEYFPLSEGEAVSQGFTWKEPDRKEYLKQNTDIPDQINDVSEDLCNKTLACITCQKNFKIVPLELKYYKKMNLPIPRKCSYCRYMERF